MDRMNGLKRTHYCGDVRDELVGAEVVVCGWAAKRRNLGQLVFIDLRDRTGILQLAFDDETAREVFEKAETVRSEFVLMAKGVVRERSSKNPDLPTGNVEVAVTDLRILGVSETPPFEIVDNSNTAELTRLKYRYLDLRRPELQKNILLRHKLTKVTRDYFDENGFIEIETPMLIKSTPEGARDFLVPSRLHNGEFYALPRSCTSSSAWWRASTGTCRSPGASGMRTCGRTGNRSSPRSTWKCPSSKWKMSSPWWRATCREPSRKSWTWTFRCPCPG